LALAKARTRSKCTAERGGGDIVRGYLNQEQPMPKAETGQAVQVLDLLLDYFGERWTRDRYDDGDGRRCLVGALYYLRGKHRVPSESAECFLHEAMTQGIPHRRGGLVYFNDRCRSFADLRLVIVEARAIALGEAERERGAAAVERWLPAEVQRERAAKVAAADKQATYFLSPRAPDETAAAPMRLAA
jgi:hypothetical protein